MNGSILYTSLLHKNTFQKSAKTIPIAHKNPIIIIATGVTILTTRGIINFAPKKQIIRSHKFDRVFLSLTLMYKQLKIVQNKFANLVRKSPEFEKHSTVLSYLTLYFMLYKTVNFYHMQSCLK